MPRRGITSRRFRDGSVRQLTSSSWADEQPEALQTRVDPGIQLTEPEAWELPTGWVSIVNDLHDSCASTSAATVSATSGRRPEA